MGQAPITDNYVNLTGSGGGWLAGSRAMSNLGLPAGSNKENEVYNVPAINSMWKDIRESGFATMADINQNFQATAVYAQVGCLPAKLWMDYKQSVNYSDAPLAPVRLCQSGLTPSRIKPGTVVYSQAPDVVYSYSPSEFKTWRLGSVFRDASYAAVEAWLEVNAIEYDHARVPPNPLYPAMPYEPYTFVSYDGKYWMRNTTNISAYQYPGSSNIWVEVIPDSDERAEVNNWYWRLAYTFAQGTEEAIGGFASHYGASVVLHPDDSNINYGGLGSFVADAIKTGSFYYDGYPDAVYRNSNNVPFDRFIYIDYMRANMRPSSYPSNYYAPMYGERIEFFHSPQVPLMGSLIYVPPFMHEGVPYRNVVLVVVSDDLGNGGGYGGVYGYSPPANQVAKLSQAVFIAPPPEGHAATISKIKCMLFSHADVWSSTPISL